MPKPTTKASTVESVVPAQTESVASKTKVTKKVT